MTAEEVLSKHGIIEGYSIHSNPSKIRESLYAAMEEYAKLAVSKQWISVEERLPEKDGRVMVCYYTNETAERFFNFVEKNFYYDHVKITSIVTHWMPLPEPPIK